jgi:tRNA-Thr(GGU) m(6)t(6)A37 methyltransferase TsaA
VPFELRPIGRISSKITARAQAPRQGDEGGVDAWILFDHGVIEALDGIESGDDILVVTWLHEASRDVLKVHPRSEVSNPLTGVFATRSPDRPNPLGLHRVTVKERRRDRLLVGPIEAIDGTPVVDVKPVLRDER